MSSPPVVRITPVVSAILAAVAGIAVSTSVARAQTLAQAANLATLVAYPGFYADRTLVVRGHVRDMNGRLSLDDDQGHRVALALRSPARPDDAVDVTGVFLDLGRSKPDDPRLTGYDMTAIVGSGQEWPRPGDLYVFLESRFVTADTTPPPKATIRSLVLEGMRAAGRQVTVAGQFSGRNLFGEQPRAPGINRWEFVIRSAGASIWVTGMQPRGKGFDFDPDRRVDSNRWLQITGTVHEDRGLMLIEATRIGLPDVAMETDGATQPKPVAPAAPPEVLFSVPTDGETGVNPTEPVRIQLSRPVARASLVNHVRVGYLATPTLPAEGIASSTALEDRNNAPSGAIAVLVIRFPQPLERFRTVRVQLLDGIKTPDGQPLKPWTLTFTVGQ